MNITKRIPVNINEENNTNIVVNLNQNVSQLDILSLKLTESDIYASFNADYGVLVGRVNGNENVGIPNAKVSIFIPLKEEDKNNPEITSIYPYTTPFDKNLQGKRYNLLPRVSKLNENGNPMPPQAFGSFPILEEIMINETYLQIYEKYYKYTTTTNSSGDYMLFGVPIGIQTVHLSVDITDIGDYSMKPIDMVVNLGYSPYLFTKDSTKIKPFSDLNDLPNIETQEISVNIRPFWGDKENFEIGITRQDFRIRAQLTSSFVIFGSTFTMNEGISWGDPEVNRTKDEMGSDISLYKIFGLSGGYSSAMKNIDITTSRTGNVKVSMYYYPSNITDEMINYDITNGTDTNIDINTDIIKLSYTDFYFFEKNGNFAVKVYCNRKKVITAEDGTTISVPDDYPGGIYTEFYGMMTIENSISPINVNFGKNTFQNKDAPKTARLRFKIPQNKYSLDQYELNTNSREYVDSQRWRKQYHKFCRNNIYSISQFIPTKYSTSQCYPSENGSYQNCISNDLNVIVDTTGVLRVGGFAYNKGNEYDATYTGCTNTNLMRCIFPKTAQTSETVNKCNYTAQFFGGQWLNMGMYFPQVTWTYGYGYNSGGACRTYNVNDMSTTAFETRDGRQGEFFINSEYCTSQYPLFGGDINVTCFSRSASYQTSFINICKNDLKTLCGLKCCGFDAIDLNKCGVNINVNCFKYTLPQTNTGCYKYDVYCNTAPQGADPYTVRNCKLDYGYLNLAMDYVSNCYNPKFTKGLYGDSVKLLYELNLV